MGVAFFVDEKYIPNDGSKEIIETLSEKMDGDRTELFIFPDVHYKKGSRVVNGLLIKSNKYIYPSCLGVANCGFTFGLLSNGEIAEADVISYVKKLAENYFYKKKYSEEEIRGKIEKLIRDIFNKEKVLYEVLGYRCAEDLFDDVIKFIKENKLMEMVYDNLCVLGGGNHFFELHKIKDAKDQQLIGQYLIAVHSDSITVGDYINLINSNLSELDFLPFRYRIIKKLKYRFLQLKYFCHNKLIYEDFKNVMVLIGSQKDFRRIEYTSKTGKSILFAHTVASIFGELNRQEIFKSIEQICELKTHVLGSHSHDSITLEGYNNQVYVIHRNGVQKLSDDKYYILPNAMGEPIYIFTNPRNEKCFYSANHGTGRISDKHIARNLYTEADTESDLKKNKVMLFRVGKGNLGEQNSKAFKNIDIISKEMKKNGMGNVIAKTIPIAVIKG